VQNASHANISGSNAPLPGDKLTLVVNGLAAAGASVDPSRVHVTVGGLDIRVAIVSQVSNTATYQVQFTLDPAVTTGAKVPVTVSIDGRTSLPVYIPINPAPGN
jgi:uncharacterized protein (TIGR03437 family)